MNRNAEPAEDNPLADSSKLFSAYTSTLYKEGEDEEEQGERGREKERKQERDTPKQGATHGPYKCVDEGEGEPSEASFKSHTGRNSPPEAPCQKSSSTARNGSPAGEKQKSSTGRSASKPRGFLIDGQKVTTAQARFVDGVMDQVEEPHEYSRAFLCHLLETGSPWDEHWVPVCARLIEKEYGERSTKRVWGPLQEAGLIEHREADPDQGLSRRFRALPSVAGGYTQAGPPGLQEASSSGYADVITGKRTRKKAKSKLTDENKNAHPPLVKGALKKIDQSIFNAPAVEEHLGGLEAEWLGAERKWTAAGRPENGTTFIRYRKARNRYANDRRCYNAILRQEPNWITSTSSKGFLAQMSETEKSAMSSSGVAEYRPAYRVQMSGRIGQIGGGFQSCTGEMKEAVYGDLPGLKNYDLKSSQPTILIRLLGEAGVDPSWLESYVRDPEAKYKFAGRAGLSVKAWKGVFYALLMGATLPQKPEQSDGDLVKIIENDEKELSAVYPKLMEAVGPLYEKLGLWHEYLVTDYLEEHGYTGNRGKTYVRNHAGMTFCPEDVRFPYKRKGKFASFLLQGKEAAYIHKLTIRSQDHGYTVLANEHDGLVTLGEIPQRAMDKAAETAELGRGRLVEKEIA